MGGWAHPDCLSNHWLLGWVAERLLSGDSILHNPDYYWPVGDAPVLAGNGMEGLLYLPFHVLLGWPEGSVAYVMAVLVCNGLAGYGLARAVGVGGLPSVFAACAAVVCPYPIQELSAGRFTQAAVFWPMAAWALWISLLERPGLFRAVLCGVLTAAAGFFYWYHALFVCLADAVTLGVFVMHRRRVPWRETLCASVVALVLIAPWMAVFASHWHAVPGVQESFPSAHSATASAPVLPRVLIPNGLHSAAVISAPVWLLGAVGCWVGRRRWPIQGLMVSACLFWLLSLGPNIPASPYVAVYGLAEPLRRFWWPVRHVVMVNAAWGALAAVGLGALLSFVNRGRVLWVGLAVCLVPIGLMARGIPIQPRFTALQWPPAVYPALAEQDDGVLIEPPLWPGMASAQQHLLYQRVHHKPLLSGHGLWVDRIRPPAWDQFVEENTFLVAMQRLEAGELGSTFSFAAADLMALRRQGVRWFSLNRELFPLRTQAVVSTYRTVAEGLFGEPILRAPQIQIWDMQEWNGATSVSIEAWVWPEGLAPGGPEIGISGRRPASLSFSDGSPHHEP